MLIAQQNLFDPPSQWALLDPLEAHQTLGKEHNNVLYCIAIMIMV